MLTLRACGSIALGLAAMLIPAHHASAQCGEVNLIQEIPAEMPDYRLGFGSVLATSMGTLAVGSDGGDYNRPVYFYEEAGGQWVLIDTVWPPDPTIVRRFGCAIDIDGDMAIIGDSGDRRIGFDAGAVHIYQRYRSDWFYRTTVIGPDVKQGDYFGWAVGMSGHTIAVGAMGDDDDTNHHQCGSVRIFDLVDGAWVQTVRLIAPDSDNNAYFGRDLILQGDMLYVGMQGARTWDGEDWVYSNGSVYIYRREASGQWVLDTQLDNPNPLEGGYFGCSLDVRDGKLLIGAQRASWPSAHGLVYMYEEIGGEWQITATLAPSIFNSHQQFGSSVAWGDDCILVGTDDANFSRRAFLFRLDETGMWSEAAVFEAASGATYFGATVALDRDFAFIAAPWEDIGDEQDAGKVYAYRGAPPARLTLNNPFPGEAGQANFFDARCASPGSLVRFFAALSPGEAPISGCPGTPLRLDNPHRFGSAVANSFGLAQIVNFVPAAFSGKSIYLQAYQADACERSYLIRHTFP